MRVFDVDTCIPERPTTGAPIALVQQPSRTALGGLVLATGASAALLLFPFWVVTARTIAQPAVIADVSAQPFVMLQLGLALLIGLFVAGFALRRFIRLVGRRREIYIERGVASVAEHHCGRVSRWQSPVAAYCGLARTVRASAAGTRYQIVMVHPDSTRHIVLALTPHLDDELFAALVHDLGLPEVSHRLIAPDARIEPVVLHGVPPTRGQLAA